MPKAWLFIVVIGTLCAACQPVTREMMVLIADPDGKVGRAEVVSSGGRQTLTEANQMTAISDPAAPPAPATRVDEAFVQRYFAAALAAQPQQPARFIFYFLPDSTELDPPSRAILPEMFAAIRKNNSVDIGVHGHADRVGTAEGNRELSLRRAMIVRDLLLQGGIPAGHIELASHGEGNPLVPTADEVSEPRNRRVEVVIR